MRRDFHRTAGVAAVVLMVVVTTVDGLTRPGYSTVRHMISHLSLGGRGWLGVATLVLCGLLFAGFGTGLLRRTATGPHPRAARWGAALTVLAGSALVVAGVFPVDAGLDYPPGEPATRTAAGSVHDLAAGALFISLIAASVLLGRATGRPRLGVALAVTVAVTFVVCSVLVAMDFAGTWTGAPGGLCERIALFLAMAWPVATPARPAVARDPVATGRPAGA